MTLKLRRLSGTDLANVSGHTELILRRPKHEPAPRSSDAVPRLEWDRVQIRDDKVADHGDAFILHPLLEGGLAGVWLRFKSVFHRFLCNGLLSFPHVTYRVHR